MADSSDVWCLAAQSCPTLCNSVDCIQSARLLCPWRFSGQEYWSEVPCPPGNLPNPGIEPRSSTLQVDSLLSEPPGKPRNTGLGSLSLLQGNFPTQESNWGLLHCRLIFLPPELPRKPLIRTVWCYSYKMYHQGKSPTGSETGEVFTVIWNKIFFLEISALSGGMR